MAAAAKDFARFSTSARIAQFACFAIGSLICFDDYAHILLTGESMRPLLDAFSVSREKLAFLVDGTAAPIVSLSPISSWAGFEVSLIQQQIDRIIALDGKVSIETDGFAVFLQSIQYRYEGQSTSTELDVSILD